MTTTKSHLPPHVTSLISEGKLFYVFHVTNILRPHVTITLKGEVTDKAEADTNLDQITTTLIEGLEENTPQWGKWRRATIEEVAREAGSTEKAVN